MIIAESLIEPEERYLTWKNNIESKGLTVNIGKNESTNESTNERPIFASGKYVWDVQKSSRGETQ